MKINGEIQSSGPVFFIIWKFLQPGQYKPVFKSEIKHQQRGIQDWNEVQLDTQTLCNNDPKQEIKFDFYRSETSGDHKHLGTTYSSLNELKNQTNMGFKNNSVKVLKYEQRRTVNFLEYVFGGCNINLSIAIDFTASNGDPKSPGSLHFLGNL